MISRLRDCRRGAAVKSPEQLMAALESPPGVVFILRGDPGTPPSPATPAPVAARMSRRTRCGA